MIQKYFDWINANVAETYGKCAEITLEMQLIFPELKRIRGHYHCPFWGAREHWWLIDEEQNIIDPTVSQFPSIPDVSFYEEHDESQPEPTGMCPNCGEYCFEGRSMCCDNCERAYIHYLNTGIL